MNDADAKTNKLRLRTASAAVGALLMVSQLAFAAAPTAPTTAPASRQLARGRELYAAQCASCHGAQGLGDGPAAYLLYPKPRNFTQGQFRITSTKSGTPTDDDLLATLKRGMPGSSMPAWGHLSEEDLKSLVAAVRELAVEGKAAQIQGSSKTMSRQKAMSLAQNFVKIGEVAALPPRPEKEKISLDRGKAVYAQNCAACHDADGRGKNKRDLLDQSGHPIWARDFTLGVFKGGSSDEEIARRLTVGMPGSPMPAAASMPAEDFWSLVAYVRSFIKPGAQQRIEQAQRTLTAKRVTTPVQSDPQAGVWKDVPATFIALTPLWWRDERIEGVNVAAIHDGSKIAIRLSWDDPTVNDSPDKPQAFTDGAAIQLSSAATPPFFAMGSKHSPVNLWHWKASWQKHESTGTGTDIAKTYPNMQKDEYPEDFQSGALAGNPMSQARHPSVVQDLRAEGFGTLTARGPDQQAVQGGARRTATGWEVVFVHALGAATDGDIALDAGATVSIGFAAWDGAFADRNGQKAVSIWHKLAIEK